MPMLEIGREYTTSEVLSLFPEAYLTLQIWISRRQEWLDYSTIRPGEIEDGMQAMRRLDREGKPARIVIQSGVSPVSFGGRPVEYSAGALLLATEHMER